MYIKFLLNICVSEDSQGCYMSYVNNQKKFIVKDNSKVLNTIKIKNSLE